MTTADTEYRIVQRVIHRPDAVIHKIWGELEDLDRATLANPARSTTFSRLYCTVMENNEDCVWFTTRQACCEELKDRNEL